MGLTLLGVWVVDDSGRWDEITMSGWMIVIAVIRFVVVDGG